MSARRSITCTLLLLVACTGSEGSSSSSPTEGATRPTETPLSDLPIVGEVAAAYDVSYATENIAFGASSVWVADTLEDVIHRVDADTGRVVSTISVGDGDYDYIFVAYGHGHALFTNFEDKMLGIIDPSTERISTIALTGKSPYSITTTGEAIWVGNHHGNPTGSVSRIDPKTKREIARIELGKDQLCCGPEASAMVGDHLWVSVPNLRAVALIDTRTNEVTDMVTTPTPCGLASGAGSVLVAECSDSGDTVTVIDAATAALRETVGIDGGVRGPVFAFGSFWVSSSDEEHPALLRIDPRTGEPTGRVPLPDTANFLTEGAEVLWASTLTDGSVLRIELSH